MPPNLKAVTAENFDLQLHTTDVFSPLGTIGSVVGADVSGTVVQIGKDVKTVKVGDHVGASVWGSKYEDEGAFAEYVKTSEDLVWIVPEGTLSFEQSAGFNST